MRRNNLIYLMLLFSLLVALILRVESLQAQEAKIINEPYKYPYSDIDKNSRSKSEWDEKSMLERHEAQKIPLNIVKALTPRALAETILEFPRAAIVDFAENQQAGYDSLVQNRPEFKRAMESSEVKRELIDIYSNLDVNKYVSEHSFPSVYLKHMSLTIAQNTVIDELPDAEISKLIGIVRERIELLKELDVPSYENLLLIRLRYRVDKDYAKKVNEKPIALNFLKTGSHLGHLDVETLEINRGNYSD